MRKRSGMAKNEVAVLQPTPIRRLASRFSDAVGDKRQSGLDDRIVKAVRHAKSHPGKVTTRQDYINELRAYANR